MHWLDIEGWFSEQDAQFVELICNAITNGVVVELGVFAGRSTAVMAPICHRNNTRYYAIDNFTGSANPQDKATRHQQERNIRELFEINMIAMDLLSVVEVIKLDSTSAASLFDDNSVDFCFIDADHSPTAVRRDIDAWWQKISNGGFLGGHDYQSPLRHTVNQFATEKHKKVLTGGRCWAIQKGSINE